MQTQQMDVCKGAKQVEELVTGISAFFAGGEISEEDKNAGVRALQDVYWVAKERHKAKYAPQKYQKDCEGNESCE